MIFEIKDGVLPYDIPEIYASADVELTDDINFILYGISLSVDKIFHDILENAIN